MNTKDKANAVIALAAAINVGMDEVKSRLEGFANNPVGNSISGVFERSHKACHTAQFVVPDVLLGELCALARFLEQRHAESDSEAPLEIADVKVLGKLMAVLIQHLQKVAIGQRANPETMLVALKGSRALRVAEADGSELAFGLHPWSDYSLLPEIASGAENLSVFHQRLGEARAILDLINEDPRVENVQSLHRMLVAAEPRNPFAIWGPFLAASIALTASLEHCLAASSAIPGEAIQGVAAMRKELARAEALAAVKIGVPAPETMSALFSGVMALREHGASRVAHLVKQYQLKSAAGSSSATAALVLKKMGELQEQWKQSATSGTLKGQRGNLDALVKASKTIPSELFGACALLVRDQVAEQPGSSDSLSNVAVGGAAALLVMQATLANPIEFNGAEGMEYFADIEALFRGQVAGRPFEPILRDTRLKAHSILWEYCRESANSAQNDIKEVLAKISDRTVVGEKVSAHVHGKIGATLQTLQSLFRFFGAANAHAVATQLRSVVEEPATWVHKHGIENLVELFASLHMFTGRLAAVKLAPYGTDIRVSELPAGFDLGGDSQAMVATSRTDCPPDQLYLRTFLEEGGEALALASKLAEQSLQKGKSLSDVADGEACAVTIRRAFHTLKGSSRMVGLSIIGDVAEAYQDLLDTCVQADVLDSRVVGIVLHGLDTIQGWVTELGAATTKTLTVSMEDIETAVQPVRAFQAALAQAAGPAEATGADLFADLPGSDEPLVAGEAAPAQELTGIQEPPRPALEAVSAEMETVPLDEVPTDETPAALEPIVEVGAVAGEPELAAAALVEAALEVGPDAAAYAAPYAAPEAVLDLIPTEPLAEVAVEPIAHQTEDSQIEETPSAPATGGLEVEAFEEFIGPLAPESVGPPAPEMRCTDEEALAAAQASASIEAIMAAVALLPSEAEAIADDEADPEASESSALIVAEALVPDLTGSAEIDGDLWPEDSVVQVRTVEEVYAGLIKAGEGSENTVSDLSEGLLGTALAESSQLVGTMEQDLLRVRRSLVPDSGDSTVAALYALRRNTHTLKGTLRYLGLANAASVLHAMEDELETGSGAEYLDAYERAFSLVREQLEDLAIDTSSAALMLASQQAQDSRQAIEDAHAAIQAPAQNPEPLEGEQGQDTTEAGSVATVPDQEAALERPVPAAPVAAPAVASRAARIPEPLQAREAWGQVGSNSNEAAILGRKAKDEVTKASRALQDMSSTTKRLSTLMQELALQAEIRIEAGRRSGSSNFDSLEMDRYGRLQEVSRFMSEAVNDIQGYEDELGASLRTIAVLEKRQTHVVGRIQGEADLRVVGPFSQHRGRFVHAIARACRDTGKKASLVFDQDADIPAPVLDRLVPAIEHILRNAVAHGIEAPADRASKAEEGTVTIGARVVGTEVTVYVRDDGRGINKQSILAKAEQMHLLGGRARESFADEEVFELMFRQGFTTAKEVTQLAGRGVGLDVVKSLLREVGGDVMVRSEEGEFTEFVLTAPSDVSTMSVLPVKVRGYEVMIPASYAVRIVTLTRSAAMAAREKGEMRLDDGAVASYVPMIDLLADVALDEATSTMNVQLVVCKRSGGDLVAFEVDELEAYRRVVLKPVSRAVTAVSGIIAGAVSASGSACLVVNPLRMRPVTHHAAAGIRKPQVMVVDDSSTVRLVTSQFLRKNGYQPIEARDGAEAMALLTQGIRPAAILLDVEMPKMDGFQVARAVRASDAVRATPIIMITSRTATKHRETAAAIGVEGYIGKPFEERELLIALQRVLGLHATAA